MEVSAILIIMKKMSAVKIYISGFGFIFSRMLWTLFAAACMIPVLAPAIAATWYEKPYAQDLSALCALVGILVFNFVRKRTAKKSRAAYIALIAEGISSGSLPKGSYACCREKVYRYYKDAKLFKAAKTAAKTAYRTALKRATPEEKREAAGEMGMVLSLILPLLVPYAGPCTMAWTFTHEEDGLLKSKCDAFSIILSNKLRVAWLIIRTVISEIISVIIITVVIAIAVELLKDSGAGIIGNWNTVVGKAGHPEFEFSEISNGITTALSLFTIWLLTEPLSMIRLLRGFLKTGYDNPPSSNVYDFVSLRLNRFYSGKETARRGDRGGRRECC